MDEALVEERVPHVPLLEGPVFRPKVFREPVLVLECIVKLQPLLVPCPGPLQSPRTPEDG